MYYRITKLVYLDKIAKRYDNIFGITNPPTNDASLNIITKTITRNKLSPFETFETFDCLMVFINAKGEILTETDVLFSRLAAAGFTIEHKMTKLIKDSKLLCFVSK